MNLSFGQWLRLTRNNVGLNQKQFADKLGVTPQTVRNWEAGRAAPTLAIEQMGVFCSALNVELETAVKAARGEMQTI